jgi:protease I
MNDQKRPLAGKRIAILVTDGFEETEMTEPRRCLEDAGAEAVVVSPIEGRVKSWRNREWGATFKVDLPLSRARTEDFDALLLPGGVVNADQLRMDEQAIQFVKGIFFEAKPVAAICHGPWILIDAGAIKGRTLTSYPSLRADLANAGAKWLDREVVFEEGLVTSRRPPDLPAFNKAMVAAFGREHYKMQTPMEAFRPEQAPRSKLPV